MIGYYNYTVILTYLGLCSGMCGIFAAINAHPVIALICLMLSGFFDMFDGLVARTKERTKHEKQFGIELDSLSDLICFGVLPAIIGYKMGLNTWYFSIILILYVLAALIRLAYFNVMEYSRQEETTECRKSYEGLPVTSVAIILPLLYPLISLLGGFTYLAYGALLLVIAVLFLSKIKITKFKLKGMIAFVLLGILALLLLVFTKII